MKYDDFTHRSVRASLAAVKVVFSKNMDSKEKMQVLEVTQTHGEIIELKISENEYFVFSWKALNDAVANHTRDFGEDK